MKITIESTTRIVEAEGMDFRVWEGRTESGVPVYCLIRRIAAPAGADQIEFTTDLLTCKPPSDAACQVFPLRMLI